MNLIYQRSGILQSDFLLDAYHSTGLFSAQPEQPILAAEFVPEMRRVQRSSI
jgi:hypothetical protein